MIVTLTSVPPRFAHLGEALSAFAAQNHRPDAVELYLPLVYRRFPGERPALPSLPEWVTVIDAETDWGPATKVLPATRRWRGKPVDLLFCDDDMRHDPGWTARFAEMRRARPQDAVCEYGRELEVVCRDDRFRRSAPPVPRPVLTRTTTAEIALGRDALGPEANPVAYFQSPGLVDVLFGFRGAMIAPDWLDGRAFDIPDIAWTVDDVWLSGMLELNGRKIWVGTGGRYITGQGGASRIAPLETHVEAGAGRIAANRHCAAYLRDTHGIWS